MSRGIIIYNIRAGIFNFKHHHLTGVERDVEALLPGLLTE